MKLLKKVLADITPDKKKPAAVQQFLKAVNAELKKKKIKATAVLGGSFAKNTWLKGDYDVDIFVKFALQYDDRKLSTLLGKALKKFKPTRLHGSRDYFWVKNHVKYEIVPVRDIKKPEQALNVTDFSPLHVNWVNKAGKKYKQDIMLAKKFCKAQGVYGAESYIRGFSGHVVDILVIHYKGFLPLLKAAAKWKPKVVIDYHNKYKGKALLMMNKSKLHSPLVLIDPVQPERNAAAALKHNQLEAFVSAAKAFLKKPSEQFFVKKETDFTALAKKGTLVKIDVTAKRGKEDIVGTKLLKAFEYFRSAFRDFGLIDSGWEWPTATKAVFWFVIKHKKLSATEERIGPPKSIAIAVQHFKKKHKKTSIKKGRIVAQVKRRYTTPQEAITFMKKQEHIKTRVVACKYSG